ncbi:phosphotransferase [Iamia majanohamensis]|uniref:Phosphotransferase n=1 Tax=Iamia majanohamensis TaxID=467976 RepID=A0AAE9Y9R5_9ACTN|nr:phosphotransferase [Iamia majanohamensis]WCO69192.1 phosphotransferase [Iamia majanohamensis]
MADPVRLSELPGVTLVRELGGGHQSRVFEAVLGPAGRRVVLKVRDADEVDRAVVEARVGAVADLAAVEPMVCRPLPLDGALVRDVAGDDGKARLATCVEHADGTPPDVRRPADAYAMGRALARLHAAMADLGPRAIPAVATLDRVGSPFEGPVQLLHGDVSAGNVRLTPAGLRIFDLDDCGYGPPLFDVANAIYMVLFDHVVSGGQGPATAFEEPFTSGYAEGTGIPVDRGAVDGYVDLRVGALGAWLDDLPSAPAGIRRASPAWRQVLRRFVQGYQPRGR